ncbi:hypothetical protein [Salipiger sp. PrR002]|uniref:hypothetical protein n=1 Tax=Salipiger sp. PrR002 TaxID=2706489 RepID=UPI0013B78032|nr:hypothetical protein [Salipiger sp. PrR002]NDW02677.1 hypothetical protein [Salipiger sp. PrR002]NDW60079.1 hypothetical protein [Salipiger sp. PrR004]
MTDIEIGTSELETPQESAAPDPREGPPGLTLRQAALIYFGGLVIVVAALVTLGFTT